MGCVNRSSKEFKNLAQDNNVDVNALELITHKYWIEKGSEDSFPSNVYIQEQLGNVQYKEPGANVRKLWKEKYSTAKEFSSIEELQVAKEKALKFFPESAIVHYKDSKGNYILTIKQPVEKIKYVAAKPISEELANARTLDLGLDNTETYSIGKVRELFDKFNTDKESKKLADKVFDLAESLGLKFIFDESLPINTLGRYGSSGVIKYRKSFFERDMFGDKKAPILLHEVIHAVSMYALSNKVKEEELPKALQDFRKEISKIYNEIKDNASLKGERGILDEKEMVAELSSPVFREKLKKIERDKESFWTKIVNIFKSLFGIRVNNPSNRLMKALENAMSAFDNDLYLRYSGALGVLREGQRENEWQFREMTAEEMRKAIKDHYIKKYYNNKLAERTKIRLKYARKRAFLESKEYSYLPYGRTDLEIPKKVAELRKREFLDDYGDLVQIAITTNDDEKDPDKPKKQPELVGYSFFVKFKTPKQLLDDQNRNLLDWLKILDDMSAADLQGYFAKMEQEYADYEMLHPEVKKKGSEYELQLAMESNSQKGAHPFTFNDGTQILAPFKLNDEQAAAINALDDFVRSNETSITLSGYAGTGKTSIMELFAKKMRQDWKPVAFTASTNKAAIVLKNRVEKAGFRATTLNKAFGIAVEPNDKVDYDAKNLVTKLRRADIDYGTVVVIDEASMISDDNYDILNRIAAEKGLKLIYVGDPKQLAPPKQNNISKVFRNGNGKVLGLTKVERTGQNPILREATDIRNGKPLSGISDFTEDGKGVAYMKPTDNASIDDVIKYYVQGLKDNPDFFRILAFRNKTVAAYNNRVRRALGYKGFIPNVGEPILGYANWGFIPETGDYRFINSESYKVTRVAPERIKTFGINGKKYELKVNTLSIEDSQGRTDQIDYVDIKGNEQNRVVATELAKVKDALWAEWRRTPKTKANKEKLQRIKDDINYIEQGLFVNDNIMMGKRTLQSKVVDFGYAMTVHKSQGSTFTHVLMDDVDISVARNQSPQTLDEVLLGIDDGVVPDYANSTLTETEDVDLQVNPDHTDVRQQLEYVAMSRATDTVTVISNNVKVPDSPLVQATRKKSGAQATTQRATPTTTQQVTSTAATAQKKEAATPPSVSSTTKTPAISNEEVWKHMSQRETPKGRRETHYTPVGQTDKRTYTVENGHIYNKEGKEVYQGESADRNKILAQLALDEDRAVRVNYRGIDYVVDNNQVITSLKTGNIMKWGKENGDRKAIIELATQRFRDYITQGKKSLATQAIDHLVTEGYDVGDEVDMQNYLANHPISSAVRAMEARKEIQEMNEIKAKAQADGTFMKAPNGKPTNLNERQWLQVRTKNFIKWFGDWINDPANASKVVDENGEPLVVYHGSKDKFTEFKKDTKNRGSLTNILKKGFYFSNKRIAQQYASSKEREDYYKLMELREGGFSFEEMAEAFGFDTSSDESMDKAAEYMMKLEKQEANFDNNLYAVFLNIKDPVELDLKGKHIGDLNKSQREEINNSNGAIIHNVDETTARYRGEITVKGLYVGTDYIAFEPNQIKSATDNNGMFSTENDDIQKYTTPEGEVYGFVDENGKIYLDRRVITAEHPMHEFTHLWDRMVQQKNPELWKRGVDLMKQLPQWKEILEDENYGKKWVEKGMSQEQLDNYVASEVHSRLVGDQGNRLLENLGKKKGYKRIINKLKEWIKDMWKNLHKTFGNWTDEELNTLTLKDFNRMTIRDFTQAKDFKEAFEDQVSDSPVDSAKRDATVSKIESYVEWQKQHITFDKGSHKYFFDGQPIDYSVTEYGQQVFGPKNIEGDHSYALAMGNAVDALTRDFFIIGEKALEKYYPNLTDERKAAIVSDLRRLKAHLDKEFHNNYKVITTEFPIAARISTPNGEKTIGGTLDMLIVDGEGNLHIFDMKAKNHAIDAEFFDKTTGQYKTVDDRRDYTFQLNGYRQILEALFPEFKNKIVDLRLIWFDTDYTRQNKGAVYTTHKESGIVTVKEDGSTTSIPLAEYDKWLTPSLKSKVEDSLLPLSRQESLSNVRPIQENWNKGQEAKPQQPQDNVNLHYENYNKRYTPRESSSIPILNEKAAALRASGWHIEFYDKKSQDGSITNEVMTISLGQRNKGFFELVKDIDLATGLPNNDYSVHFKTKSKKGLGGDKLATVPLTDVEKKAMFGALAQAIPDGANVSTWGELSEGGVHGINRFKEFGFTQTGTRKVKHKNGGDLTIPVLTKGAVQQTNTQQQAQQQQINISDKVQTHQGNWSRQEAQNNPRILYVFTDNTDRDSGSGVIPESSWYSKKYGKGHHYPTMTAAVVRGLDNARPISTQRWYHQGAKGNTGRWTDANVEEFKTVIREELQEIANEFNTGKYDTIMFPSGDGLFNTNISNITKQRTPQLYQALADLLHEFGFDNLIPSDVIPSTQQQQTTLPGPETKINIYSGTGENADLSNFAARPFTSPEGLKIESVEQGFHYGKFEMLKRAISSAYTARDAAYTDIMKQINALQKDLMDIKRDDFKNDVSYGAKLKSIGNTRLKAKDSDIQSIIDNFFARTKVEGTPNWENDRTASNIMKALIKASFEQNTQALQRLLETGNATLTHMQDRSKWGTEFPKLLMEVRKELREEHPELMPSQSTVQQAQQKASVQFTESTGGYPQRTKENAEWSDATLAFAIDFNTAGEKLTKRVAGNKYHAFSIANIKGTSGINNQSYITTGFMSGKRWASVQQIKEKFPKGLKINIAGNGIYTLLPKGISQEDVNDYIEGFLYGVRQEGVIISEVRSGGQTGIDEAGIIAALRLGIPASVHAPKGYTFRDKNNKDINNEVAFKNRFNIENKTQGTIKPPVAKLEKGTWSADHVYKELKKQYPEGTPMSKLVDMVFKALEETGTVFEAADLGTTRSGRFIGSENKVQYNINAIRENTILHESIHAVTSYYLKAVDPKVFSPEIQTAIEEIKECHRLLKEDFIQNHFYENGKLKDGIDLETAFVFHTKGSVTDYGFLNPSEMVAEMSNPEFLERIRDFDRRHKGQNIFDRLINAVASLLGLRKNYTTVEDTIKKALETLITNPSKEMAEKYAEQNRNYKNNTTNLNKSNRILINNKEAIDKFFKTVPEDFSEEWIDTTLELDAKNPQLYTSYDHEGRFTWEDAPVGSIMVYNSSVYFMLSDTPKTVGNKVQIKVRAISAKGLKMNGLNIKRDEVTGIDYVESAKPLFAFPVGSIADIPSSKNKPEVTQAESNTEPASKTQKLKTVSLPSYEYFKDMTTETTVDADWKIPLLKALDAKLSNETPLAELNDILEKMDKIIKAENEEDINKPESEKKKEEKQVLSEYERITTQINNLLDSDVISASEVRHVAELIMNSISDNITALQTTEGLAKKQFPSLNTDLDFKTASRKEIVAAVGINRLIARAKAIFEKTDYEDFEAYEQAPVIIENWEALMLLAADQFAANEGFGIVKDPTSNKFETTKDADDIGFDEFAKHNDEDAKNEEEGDEQERWQIESRTIDILRSMSELVRIGLHNCYQMEYYFDEQGQRKTRKVYSKWGIAERVNPRQAVNNILRWTQGALTLQEMVDMLKTKMEDNPWVEQLIDRLEIKKGQVNNDTDFQSQFFGVMSKHFQLYSIVLGEDGKYHSMEVNRKPALKEARNTVITQYQIGQHPLFTSNRTIKKELLGTIYTVNSNNNFNLHKALTALQIINKAWKENGEISEEMLTSAIENVVGVSRLLGYQVNEDIVKQAMNEKSLMKMTTALEYMVRRLDNEVKVQDDLQRQGKIGEYSDIFAYDNTGSIRGDLLNFLEPITEVLEDSSISAFYDSGKMYQSYVTPSFLTKLMNKFHIADAEKFKEFIENEYGFSEWYKDKNGWRNEWLEDLATDPKARKIFEHKVELNFNKHNYMRNMSDAEYTLSLLTEYFSVKSSNKDTKVPAWFRMPMQSNKPSSEYIKFWSYRGDDYKENIVYGMLKMFNQELSRINTVMKRNPEGAKKRADFIKNFDTNGRKFNYLPFLNPYLENTAEAKAKRTLFESADKNNEFAKLLQEKLNSKDLKDAEGTLKTLAEEAIFNHMQKRVNSILDAWEKNGILAAAKKVEGIGKSKEAIRASVENFLWNDNYAAKNILQLTIGDIAFYKDAEDLQKRLAQLHAPGTRANIAATDYKGNRVSDGTYRTFILKDFDSFRSNIVANIEEVFDRKIAAARPEDRPQLEALKDSLVRKPGTNGEDDKGGAYYKINVADAQGFCSPSSYRKKAFLFGKWSKKAENIYEKLLAGEVNYTDLETAFQPLKPFVYSKLKKDMGVEGAPITKMPVPFQAKNAEYLLIMADAIIKNEVNKSGELSRPNLLRAVYRVMEESEQLHPREGIDTVQFESAIKSGLQGAIDISVFAEMEGGEESAYKYMSDKIYKKRYFRNKQTGEVRTQYDYKVNETVHEASYEDYCLQQEVPPHFQNHSQAHGSQVRMIIPSDLDLYVDDTLKGAALTDPSNRIYYEITEPDGTVKKLTAEQFRKEYEDTISEGIEESLEELNDELLLYKKEINPETGELVTVKNSNRRERNIALSKILQREILSSPRYGVDLIQACSIDRRTGEFRIPKGDPIQAKRIEQLINSIIKNRVNKQKIAGGPIVQVSNFGTSKQLQIRFKDKQGNLLMSRSEFAAKNKNLSEEELNAKYKEFIKKNQGGIAYFEVFAPIWSKDLFHKFADVNGNIDIKAIEMVAPELLEMVSYRIPTEDKYSCAPMRVVGFMPKEAGDAIMLPWELTEIDDSDFDVDKRYVMRKEIDIYTRFEPKENQTMIEAEKEYIKHNREGIYKYLRKHVAPRITEEDKKMLAKIEKQVKSEFDIDRRTQEKEHERRLDEITKVSSLIDESNNRANEKRQISDKQWEKRDDKEESRYQRQVDKENERFKLQMDLIDSREQSEINKRYNTWLGNSFNEKLDDFVTYTKFFSSEQDDAMTREIREAYMKYMYKAIKPTKYTNAKAYRNNKIIDMSLAVLTHERTADKILNPGGFEAPKRVGYMVAAYRNPANNLSWKELQNIKDTDELKKLCYADKDLTWADTQVQFYKQNSAAASLIGVFAVNKVAHATLESDGIWLAVDEICGDKSFTIGDTTFGGMMEIDKKFDSKGTLIGKTLGSLVSASADAVKDPILNLMNINMTTAGMLNTMLRLGMPFEEAALFLSQDVVGRLLDRFNRENLTNYVSLSFIIEKMLKEASTDKDAEGNDIDLGFSNDSKITDAPITKEDMIKGLTADSHKDIDYKVLLAFEKIRGLTDAMRKPTFATRFNSISSAVGPLIVDNLILERKMNSFTYDGKNSTHFYKSKGDRTSPAWIAENMVTIDTIHKKHPILKSFAKTVEYARDMFEDMPAGSEGFRNFLATIPGDTLDKIFGDKKLFSQLSDFYQSFMLIASGVVDQKHLKTSIEGFPTYFVKGGFKEKYPDNALIQAITLSKGKNAKYPVLQIQLTGLDEAQKEVYRNAWIDIHKDNPTLSRRLFEYCFFRAGIGFNPKTFMALVPTYVKERLETDLGNGRKTSYVKTYEKLSTENMSAEVMYDQFIRNNWNENKLVPKKKGDSFRFNTEKIRNEITGRIEDIDALYITSKEDVSDVEGNMYIKVKRGKEYQLWKFDRRQGDKLIYHRTSPLGNNGEYLEINTSNIISPMNVTTALKENSEETGMPDTSAAESDANDTAKKKLISEAETAKRIERAVERYMSGEADDYLTNGVPTLFEEHFSMMRNIMDNRLTEQGIEIDKDKFMDEYNKYC